MNTCDVERQSGTESIESETASCVDAHWWKIVLGTSGTILAVSASLYISLLVYQHHSSARSDTRLSPAGGAVSVVESTAALRPNCAEHTHSRECDNNSLCVWNIHDYKCTPRFQPVSESNSIQCQTQFFKVESKSDCTLASSYVELLTHSHDTIADFRAPDVVVVNDPGHPQGCYWYKKAWHFNEAKYVQPTSSISDFEFVCKRVPSHCFNGVLDCDVGEIGIDCGNVCKQTCSNVDNPCPPPKSTQLCKRSVYASNDKWSAMFLYLWTTLISSISTKRQTLDCTNDEYIYNSQFGRCTLDDKGKLRISVTGFESTHALCNMDGFPASHDSPDFRLEDDTIVRGTCSTLYFIHPMTVVTKQDRRNTYNMPWEWNDPFANEQAARKSDEYWRSQLICSPFHEDRSKAVYTERCCFGY